VDEVVAYTIGQGTKMQRYYPHYSHLYSVAALTGDKLPNGNVPIVERYRYDAYGKQTITGPSGSVRIRASVGWDRGFTGYVADNETGLLHARARQYSPTLGRFVSRDPSAVYSVMRLVEGQGRRIRPMAMDGYQDGYNLVSANFIPNELDPTGQYSFKCWVDIVEFVVAGPAFYLTAATAIAMPVGTPQTVTLKIGALLGAILAAAAAAAQGYMGILEDCCEPIPTKYKPEFDAINQKVQELDQKIQDLSNPFLNP